VLAKKLNKKLIELDSLIELKAGKSITRIFQEDGEIAFRQLEIEAAKEVAAGKNQVIACGGGIVLNKINIDRLNEKAVVVYLMASPEVIQERVSTNGVVRPLLKKSNKATAIKELIAFRQPFYERAADIKIDTSKLDIEAVVEQIIARL
jgi:shikimate kinase